MANKRVARACVARLCAVLLLSGASAGCAMMAPPPAAEPVDIVEPLVEEISATGEVAPRHWASLAFPNGAEGIEVAVQVGDAVTEGQELCTCSDTRLTAALYQAQAALIRAENAYATVTGQPAAPALAGAEAALANARAQFDRLERAEAGGAEAGGAELDAARADVTAAEMSLETVRAGATDKERVAAALEVRAAQTALEHARAAMSITAPFEGHVVEVYARSGEAIGALQPVLLVADLSRLVIVTTDLSEVDVTGLRIGQPAQIVFDALAGRTLTGTITRIAPRSSGGSSVYYAVTVESDELPAELRWGMTAFVTFER
jgi:multidrug resistance efflux pump